MERSVAVVASGRLGKVACETIEEREVCLGCGINPRSECLDAGSRFAAARWLLSPEIFGNNK